MLLVCRVLQAELPPGTPSVCLDDEQAAQQQAQQQGERNTSHAAASSSSSGGGGTGSSAAAAPIVRSCVFDWNDTRVAERFDVVLACDVLYENDAVAPIAEAVPRLLRATGGQLLLADPPNRTAANRERFLQLLSGSGSGGFTLNECSQHQCEVRQLDLEMLGGISAETIPVQLMVLRRSVGKDTVGLKL